MKHKLVIISILLCFSHTVNAQFDGSFGDGFAVDESFNILLTSETVMLYFGGPGDGFAIDESIKNLLTTEPVAIYFGGNGDGFALDESIKNLLTNETVAIYFGGNGDGFAGDESIKNLLTGEAVAIYFGGNGDGFAGDESIKNLLTGDAVAIYFGGNGDGYAVDESIKNLLTNEAVVIYFGGNGDGFSSSQETLFINPNQIVDLALNIKALLQGATINPIDINLMNDVLRVGGLIPIVTPYSDLTSIDPAILNTGGVLGTGAIADNIVDWVWIEIRSTSDDTFIVDDTSALIQRDGDIVSLDGLSNVTLEGFADSYFVVVKHRNHLGIMTSNPIPLSTGASNIDFTNSATSTYGSNAQVQIAGGLNALWAGNVNGDTIIQYSGTNPDSPSILSEVLNDPGNTLNFATYMVNGYNVHDVNMDGNTQYSGITPDTPILLQNALAHPENVINFSTYQIKEQLPEN